MTVISLEKRLRKIEAARAEKDHAIRALSDEELAACLYESDEPIDHALADWFLAGGEGPLPDGALDALRGVGR